MAACEASVQEGVEAGRSDLARLKTLGVDLDMITERLQKDGVNALIVSLDKLLANLDKKRRAIYV